MKKHLAKDLIHKYMQGTATPEERVLVETAFLKDLENSAYTPSQERIEEADKRIMANLVSHLAQKPNRAKVSRLWPRIAAAAAVLLFLSFGTYFLLHKKAPSEQLSQNQIPDITPGGNKAILTLGNGEKIILNTAHNGLLAEQGVSTIDKTPDGAIVYRQAAEKGALNAGLVAYNAITIPRGGEYQVIILPDGTKVWINSASSLRYPTAFTGNERKVELTGEAYFEVTHNPAKPFRVTSKGQTVEVMGTGFNVNSYDDEPAVKTTLLEGKVKVTATSSDATRILQPGQQAVLNTRSFTADQRSFTVDQVDTEEAVAWKNGQFMFNNTNITYIMRTLSRWYDVDVDYNGTIPGEGFYGGVSRFKNVSEVLNTLQLTGKVHFKITGRKITVSR